MCGICGVVTSEPREPISEGQLVAMRDSMVHRGPDDAGHLLLPGVALGSRRLAILDLSERGHMPMSTPDGRYHIVYNGEVYNYRELRPALEARGFTFRSDCDTEVLLYLYVAEGPAMLDKLNGMFAFAIWDTVERKLFIARDRLGIKPLYYAEANDALYFASEAKALFAAGIDARFDASKWEEMLAFRFVAGEETTFAGVRRLLPGHWMLWKDGDIRIHRWWNLGDRARALAGSAPREPLAWYRETFDNAVGLRRISDVPLGVLLSGGLDSSTVGTSLAIQAGDGIAGFTVRFAERDFDEGPLARQLAEKYHLVPYELTLSSADLMSRLHRASWFNDEPLVHGNDPHIWAISEFAKSRVTVLLSGEGADEVMGGYVRYQPLRYRRLLGAAQWVLPGAARLPGFSGRVQKLARMLALGSLDRLVMYNSCDTFPADLELLGLKPTGEFAYREQVLTEAVRNYPGELMRQAMYFDQHTFLCSLLDRNDRMTMAASIECRVPFLDYRLVERLAAMPSKVLLRGGGGSKALLRDSLGSRLPQDILKGRKWGFGVPWAKYFREPGEFRDLLMDLPRLAPICDGPFDSERLRAAIADFLAGNNRLLMVLRQMVLTAIWHQTYFDGVRERHAERVAH